MEEWVYRAPKELVQVHNSAACTTGLLAQIRTGSNLMVARLEGSTSTSLIERNARFIAADVVALRDGAREGGQFLAGVEEEFGCVARGVAVFRQQFAHSFHRLTFHVALSETHRIVQAVGLGAEEENMDAYHTLCNTFSAEAIAPYILAAARSTPEAIAKLGISSHDHSQFLVRLKQEMFRAWKQKYPDNSARYEKMWTSEQVAKLTEAGQGDSFLGTMAELARKGLDWPPNVSLIGVKLSDAERRIMEIVEQAGRRLTTDNVLRELEQRYGAASVGTTKSCLASLVRRDLLSNRQDVSPNGYGLPAWD